MPPVRSAVLSEEAVLHVREISRITCDRFLVSNEAARLWLPRHVCLELIAGRVGGAVVFYVAALQQCYPAVFVMNGGALRSDSGTAASKSSYILTSTELNKCSAVFKLCNLV